jgi:hypothetical protein
LEPAKPIRRYERENPGDFIHVNIKKLARIGSVGHLITGRQRGDCRKAVLGADREPLLIDRAPEPNSLTECSAQRLSLWMTDSRCGDRAGQKFRDRVSDPGGRMFVNEKEMVLSGQLEQLRPRDALGEKAAAFHIDGLIVCAMDNQSGHMD